MIETDVRERFTPVIGYGDQLVGHWDEDLNRFVKLPIVGDVVI